MKRIQLFEFEDFAWFPGWIRELMTNYIVAIHKLLGSSDELADLLAKALKYTDNSKIIDLCSGGGGPMLEVAKILKEKHGVKDLNVTMTDLYPNTKAAAQINSMGDPSLSYTTEPVNAANVDASQKGVRTMVCSMHHMNPEVAHNILKDAKEAAQPICVFEISDNSHPKFIWWAAIPINIIVVFLVTLFVRPMSWKQVVFTYIIPILPLLIAWDGAVSNARTYTLEDLDEVLKGLESDTYTWEKGIIKGKSKKVYLLGYPTPQA